MELKNDAATLFWYPCARCICVNLAGCLLLMFQTVNPWWLTR